MQPLWYLCVYVLELTFKILPAVWTTTAACTTAHHNTNFHEKWREQEIKAFNNAHLPTPKQKESASEIQEKKKKLNSQQFKTKQQQKYVVCRELLNISSPTWKRREWNGSKTRRKKNVIWTNWHAIACRPCVWFQCYKNKINLYAYSTAMAVRLV